MSGKTKKNPPKQLRGIPLEDMGSPEEVAQLRDAWDRNDAERAAKKKLDRKAQEVIEISVEVQEKLRDAWDRNGAERAAKKELDRSARKSNTLLAALVLAATAAAAAAWHYFSDKGPEAQTPIERPVDPETRARD